MQKPREIATRILLRREQRQDYVENILDEVLAATDLPPADRRLCTELVYGTARWQTTLDWLIARKTQPDRWLREELRILLRLGLYQMFWLDRIPDHAVVHETVELGRKMGFHSQAGLLNAILRGYGREKVETKLALVQLQNENPALGHAQPAWLVQRWQKRWGLLKTMTLLEWNNLPAETFARVNTLKTDARKLTGQWLSENVKFTSLSFDWTEADLIFRLDSHPPLALLPSFQQGLFYVQDPGTLLAVHALAPQPDETILDVCAAPGGKTTLIAQQMQNRGKIVAEDIDSDRLKLVQENAVRLGATNVAPAKTAPANHLLSAPAVPPFDRILVDAPCSNTGVLRRRIDLRWRIQPEEIPRLRETQLHILRQSVPRLKPGGTLVYSTCSLEAEENTEVVKTFLAQHPRFKLESERALLPFADQVDGAYVAKLHQS